MQHRSPARGPSLAVVLAVAVSVTGCVERRMIVRTNPAGARIQIDGEDVEGTTPLEVPFDWGGVRRVTAMAPGYKVLEQQATLTSPWYTAFPIDVFTDLLWPGTIEDLQAFDFTLEPYSPADEPFTAAQQAEIERRLAGLVVRAEAHRTGGVHGPDAAVLAGGGTLRSVPPGGGRMPGGRMPGDTVPGETVPGDTVPPVRMEGDERPPVRFGTDPDEPPPPPPAPIRDGR